VSKLLAVRQGTIWVPTGSQYSIKIASGYQNLNLCACINTQLLDLLPYIYNYMHFDPLSATVIIGQPIIVCFKFNTARVKLTLDILGKRHH
jgi:hypothetical protein